MYKAKRGVGIMMKINKIEQQPTTLLIVYHKCASTI
jgi:hypothetical protein